MAIRKTCSTPQTGFLPSPANPVGFVNFDLTDASRFDPINRSNRRKVNVSVWYPAETNDPKFRKKYFECYNSFAGKPYFNIKFWSRKCTTSNFWTNSYQHAPVSERRDQYPVLLFSHDLGNTPADYTALMEHLASEGYFIFSINHCQSWGMNLTLRTVGQRLSAWWKSCKIRTMAKWLSRKAEKNLVGKSYEQKWNWSRTNLHLWDGLQNIYSEIARDQAFLLDFLYGITSVLSFNEYPYSLFAQRIDLQNVGAIGHGWGGAAAIDVLVSDRRIKASMNLDGFQFSEVKNYVIEKPMFMIYSQQCTGINAGIYFNASDSDVHTIGGTNHLSFTDAPFLRKEDAHNQQVVYDVSALAVSFFDRHLKKVNHLASLRHYTKQKRPTIL